MSDLAYALCKIICTSQVESDDGKSVMVSSYYGGFSKTQALSDGKCTFLVPPRDKYTISLMSDAVAQYTTTIVVGYGECRVVEVGMGVDTPEGLKRIVNAGLEEQFLEAGDTIMVTENNKEVAFDVLHVGYRTSKYGHNIILGRHLLLDETKQMRSSNTNSGGYNSSNVKTYLEGTYYSLLSSDWQNVISKYSFQSSAGSQSSSLQVTETTIWIPMEYNIFGATQYAAASEHTSGGAEQFAYFATASNRSKCIGSSAAYWWLASPNVGYADYFCRVALSGGASNDYASASNGVCPCFMIAENNE